MTLPQQWIAYCGPGATPLDWLARWTFDPALLALLAAATIFYWHKSRGFAFRRGRFVAAQAVLLLLFVSPLCALGAALFSTRVVHHVLLIGLAAPLLVAAMPARVVRPRVGLLFWTSVQTIALWVWHAPGPYGWAVSHDPGFWAMQATLLASACGFWAAVRRAAMPGAVAALLATTVQMGLLGALITFAGAPLYPPHYLTTFAWGISPLEDQQLGGLIMWAPAAGLYLAAALLFASRWLGPAPTPAR